MLEIRKDSRRFFLLLYIIRCKKQGTSGFLWYEKRRTGYEKRLFASLQEPQILYISLRLLPDRIVPNIIIYLSKNYYKF